MKLTSKRAWQGLFVLMCVGIATMFQNCGIQRPTVENQQFASVGMSHTGAETSCSACHEIERPTSTAGFIGLNVNAPFDYTTHASGQDCIICHNMDKVGIRNRADWANGFYDHPVLLTSCVSCHDSQRPGNSAPDLARTGGFDHTAAGQGECFGCHSSAMNSTFSSLQDWSGGIAAPAVLKYIKTITVNSLIPTYTGTTISAVTATAVPFNLTMNHQTSQLSTAVLNNCSACHAPGNTTYANGILHASLSAQPAKCDDCHNASHRPVGFVGLLNNTRGPATGPMKHDAVVWSKNAAGAFVPTAMPLVGTDCAVCHKPPAAAVVAGTNGWEAGKYHSALTAAAMGQPSSCLDCHANSRKSGVITGTLTAFDHATDVKGMGDCIACHAVKADWTAGIFHQAGLTKPTTCNACHDSQRPDGTKIIASNGTPFNFTAYDSVKKPFDVLSTQNDTFHGGARDCAQCHAPVAYATMANWSGGLFHNAVNNPGVTSCSECHESQRPTAAIASSATNGIPTGQTFNHATDGLGDCIGCHKATVTRGVYLNYQTANATTWGDTDWRGGITYDPVGLMGPDPTVATPTKKAATVLTYSDPANFVVGSTSTVTLTFKDQIKHTSSQVPAALWTGMVVGSSLDQAKCNTCHLNLPTKFAPGKFHPAVTAASLTSCGECHVNTIPTGIVVPATDVGTLKFQPMDHAANLSGGKTAIASFDCATCHLNTQAGGSFNNAGFHAKIGTQSASSCTVCHYLTMPLVTQSTGVTRDSATSIANFGKLGFFHSNKSTFASGDCALCHNMTNAAIIGKGPVSTSWSGGLFHANKAPASITSCSDCHNAKPTTRPTLSNVDGQRMSHTSTQVRADCYACHKTDIVAGVTPTTASWSKSALFHKAGTNTTIAGDAVTTCNECHGLTNGGGTVAGTNNNIPAATLTMTSAYSFTFTVAKTMADKISHTDPSVAGVECIKCHSNAANMGVAGTKWKGAKMHTNITALNAATNCATCHTIANADHPGGAIAVGTDCKSCHKYPGTGVMGSATNPPNWKGATGSHPSTGPTAGSTNDCSTCHGPTGTALVKLKVAVTSHYYVSSTPGGAKTIKAATCIGCHSNYTAFKGNGNLKFAHTLNTYYCMDCHNYNSGSYTSFTTLAKFANGTNTMSGATNVTARNRTSNHNNVKFDQCAACHTYTAPVAGANIWGWKHDPTNPGVNFGTGSVGCNWCH